MRDPFLLIADRFDAIVKRCDRAGRPTGLSHAERVIYYVVAVRCEAAMNGFCSVFEQLLSESELAFFVSSLRELDQPALADTYERIGLLLSEAGYFADPTIHFHELPEPVLNQFAVLEREARTGNLLWGLDSALLSLIETQP